MSDDAIIAALLAIRNRCQQLTQWYQSVRAGGYSRPHVDSMSKADSMLTQVLDELKDLPKKPSQSTCSPAKRTHVESLLAEISELLERALVADREFRAAGPVVPGLEATPASMRMYTRL